MDQRAFSFLSALFAALTLTLAVSPAEPGQGEEPAPASTRERDDLVCKRERVIGSHIRKRTCRTRAQIEAEREATQKAIEDLSKTRGPNSDGG